MASPTDVPPAEQDGTDRSPAGAGAVVPRLVAGSVVVAGLALAGWASGWASIGTERPGWVTVGVLLAWLGVLPLLMAARRAEGARLAAVVAKSLYALVPGTALVWFWWRGHDGGRTAFGGDPCDVQYGPCSSGADAMIWFAIPLLLVGALFVRAWLLDWHRTGDGVLRSGRRAPVPAPSHAMPASPVGETGGGAEPVRDVAARIDALADLHARGAIDRDEFDELKRRAIDGDD